MHYFELRDENGRVIRRSYRSNLGLSPKEIREEEKKSHSIVEILDEKQEEISKVK